MVLVGFAAAVMIPPALQIFKLGGNTPDLTESEMADWIREVNGTYATPVASQGGELARVVRARESIKRRVFRKQKVG